MPYALTAPMKGNGASIVHRMWQVLAECGLADDILALNYHPHVTLAVVDREISVPKLLDVVSDVCDRQRNVIPISLHGFLTFPGPATAICVAPTVSHELTMLHRRTIAALGQENVRDHYRENVWVPHVTLTKAIGTRSQLTACLEVLLPIWQSTEAELSSIEVIRFRPIELIAARAFSLASRIAAAGSL